MAPRIKPIILSLLAASFFTSCVDEQNRDDCKETYPQGLEISLYSQSRCQSQPEYPSDIRDADVFIFDSNSVLFSSLEITEITLSEEFYASIELQSGLYSALGWSVGDKSLFNIIHGQEGSTAKNDIYLSIRRNDNKAVSLEGIKVFNGKADAVYVRDAGNSPAFERMAVNMLEVTNRITVTVEGLPGDMENYSIAIESNNGTLNLDGTIAEDDDIIYEGIELSADGILGARFTLLKLDTGYNYTIVILNNQTGTELYRGSLLGALILKNPYADLNCDHDFNIRFTAEDQCNCGTYMIAEIWVNNWLVHSYGKDF